MRYLPLTPEDRSEMLARIGVADIDELFADIPVDKRLEALPDLPRTKSEIEVERVLGRMAGRNVAAGAVPFFVGCGAYKHHIPASVDHLIQRSEFLTSYTPYQPEIAQGTLHYLFEFQTQVALLTGTLHPHYTETIATVSRLAGDEIVAPAPHGAAEDLSALIDNTVSCVV